MTFKRGPFISMTLLLLLGVLPLLLGIIYALLYSFGVVGVLNNGFTLEHWKAAFSTAEIPESFLYTISLGLASLFLCTICGIFLALALGKKWQKGIASYLVYLPMAFPSVAAAFFFFQFLSNAGFISRLLFHMGLVDDMTGFGNLVNDRFSIGIITAQVFLTLPVFIVLYTAIIENEQLEKLRTLAFSLGASRSYTTWHVTVPVLLQKSFPTMILYFIFKLGSYEIPLLLGRSRPETISVLTVRKMQRFNLMDIPQGYAVAVLYAILVMLLLAFTLKPAKISSHV